MAQGINGLAPGRYGASVPGIPGAYVSGSTKGMSGNRRAGLAKATAVAQKYSRDNAINIDSSPKQ